MKTVIFSLTNKVCNIKSDNTNNFWGIGDMVRGIVCVYHICKRLQYNFIIDIQYHPISLYLKERTHDYTELIYKNKDSIPFIYPENSENYISNHKDNIIFFITNDIYKGEIDIKCKELLRDLFIPNEKFQHFIDNKLLNINLKDYSVIHFRLGDDYLVRKIINRQLMNKCHKIFLRNREKNQIVMTDNDYFKNMLIKSENVFTFDTKSVHLGYKDHETSIQDTLFEFIVLLNVSKIKHYSAYGWTSGFINTANIINDIELIKM
jgi:hypothetical protein